MNEGLDKGIEGMPLRERRGEHEQGKERDSRKQETRERYIRDMSGQLAQYEVRVAEVWKQAQGRGETIISSQGRQEWAAVEGQIVGEVIGIAEKMIETWGEACDGDGFKTWLVKGVEQEGYSCHQGRWEIKGKLHGRLEMSRWLGKVEQKMRQMEKEVADSEKVQEWEKEGIEVTEQVSWEELMGGKQDGKEMERQEETMVVTVRIKEKGKQDRVEQQSIARTDTLSGGIHIGGGASGDPDEKVEFKYKGDGVDREKKIGEWYSEGQEVVMIICIGRTVAIQGMGTERESVRVMWERGKMAREIPELAGLENNYGLWCPRLEQTVEWQLVMTIGMPIREGEKLVLAAKMRAMAENGKQYGKGHEKWPWAVGNQLIEKTMRRVVSPENNRTWEAMRLKGAQGAQGIGYQGGEEREMQGLMEAMGMTGPRRGVGEWCKGKEMEEVQELRASRKGGMERGDTGIKRREVRQLMAEVAAGMCTGGGDILDLWEIIRRYRKFYSVYDVWRIMKATGIQKVWIGVEASGEVMFIRNTGGEARHEKEKSMVLKIMDGVFKEAGQEVISRHERYPGCRRVLGDNMRTLVGWEWGWKTAENQIGYGWMSTEMLKGEQRAKEERGTGIQQGSARMGGEVQEGESSRCGNIQMVVEKGAGTGYMMWEQNKNHVGGRVVLPEGMREMVKRWNERKGKNEAGVVEEKEGKTEQARRVRVMEEEYQDIMEGQVEGRQLRNVEQMIYTDEEKRLGTDQGGEGEKRQGMRTGEGTTAGGNTERIEKEHRKGRQLGWGTGEKGTGTNENCSKAWVRMADVRCGGKDGTENVRAGQETELEETGVNAERAETGQDTGIRRETRKDSPYKKWWDGRRRNQAVAEMIEEWAAEGVAGGGERNQVQCC